MSQNVIFSVTGCARCRITKQFMQDRRIAYEEFDIRANGKEAFSAFYRIHRKNIFRDDQGVEFPVFTDGTVIKQGVSVIIAWLIAEDRLSSVIRRSRLHGEWLDGIHVSSAGPDDTQDLLAVMFYLKGAGLKLEVFSDGPNSGLLKTILEKNLAHRVIVDIKGPEAIWAALSGPGTDPEDLKKTLAVAARFPEYQFYTMVRPVIRTGEDSPAAGFLTPDEIGETAQMIEAATGSKKQPYLLKPWDAAAETDDRLKEIDPLPEGAMFKYRTRARRYMVMAEIE